MKIAVVGAGISGLTAAYLLRREHEVTVFERGSRPGGHANTMAVRDGARSIGVDTGFIVYNETTYPGFTALLSELGVPTQPSDMSFGSTCERCGIGFSSRGIRGLFADASSLVRPALWSIPTALLRFYRDGNRALAQPAGQPLTLNEYADRFGRDSSMIRHVLLPMTSAIWSTSRADAGEMPFMSFVRFLANHGVLGWRHQLEWRTVMGGSQTYVRRLTECLPAGSMRVDSPVQSIHRTPAGPVVNAGREERFDAVVLACHADEAAGLLCDADADEAGALSGFSYTNNRVVLHTDAGLLPRHSRVRASWNVVTADCTHPSSTKLTYDMNRLQSLRTRQQFCVSVDPGPDLDPGSVLAVHEYAHPKRTLRTEEAQRRLETVQGRRATYYAGAHLGYGFHEDGYQSGLRVARLLQEPR